MIWEFKWIDDHPHLYDGPMHMEAVKRNIEKRHRILELKRQLKEKS